MRSYVAAADNILFGMVLDGSRECGLRTESPGTGVGQFVGTGRGHARGGERPAAEFHLGLWFGTPEVAVAAGCPNAVTPFNGDHTAGIQVQSTRNFANGGPLRSLAP